MRVVIDFGKWQFAFPDERPAWRATCPGAMTVSEFAGYLLKNFPHDAPVLAAVSPAHLVFASVSFTSNAAPITSTLWAIGQAADPNSGPAVVIR